MYSRQRGSAAKIHAIALAPRGGESKIARRTGKLRDGSTSYLVLGHVDRRRKAEQRAKYNYAGLERLRSQKLFSKQLEYGFD
jgi:hypothetical protein